MLEPCQHLIKWMKPDPIGTHGACHYCRLLAEKVGKDEYKVRSMLPRRQP